jgi:hypothetical protein
VDGFGFWENTPNYGSTIARLEVVDAVLEQASKLKQALLDFVLEAEGDLAVSLETFSAAQMSLLAKSPYQGSDRHDSIVDLFLTEGEVGNRTPIELYLAEQPNLTESDRALVTSWQRSVLGLFAAMEIGSDGFELMNWLTAKRYQVKIKSPQEQKQLSRVKAGEILLARIAPVTDTYWMFSGPWVLLGKLGKPKLAVAIGNFKQYYQKYLYSDAPELLAESWRSVEQYHDEFVDFFGSDELTLSGYELNKKMIDFQKKALQNRLNKSGIDRAELLQNLAETTAISQGETPELSAAVSTASQTMEQLLAEQETPKMVMPEIQLPEHLKKAEYVTALSHPRWGQMFLTNYHQLKTFLEEPDLQQLQELKKLVDRCLADGEMNAYVWYRLARQYPEAMNRLLQTVLERPNFDIRQDLALLLQKFNKPLEPELPETASVPLHLHQLFQAAFMEVNKPQPKGNNKRQSKGGFKN